MSNLENKALAMLDGIAAENGLTGTPEVWQTPQPLTAKVEAEDYPLHALPDMIRAAVMEYQGVYQAPPAMVATSALTAMSLAIQSLYDIRRASFLESPSGIYALIIADSGERKTTCDTKFMQGVKDVERDQEELFKPIIKKFKAEYKAWESECEGLQAALKQTSKDNKPEAAKKIAELKATLEDLHLNEPEAPRVPRFTFSDVTPEALASHLGNQFPSGGIVSSEGGAVFGSHGMKSDSLMKNLSTLNQLWDGGELRIDRRTSESFTVRGARLTAGIMIQEATLRAFFEKSGELARGTGFLARFLVAMPESTQGTRFYVEPPNGLPNMESFTKRIRVLCLQSAKAGLNESGGLEPQVLDLSPAAKSAWVNYYNVIEAQLASGGELFDVRDIASKSADNAARIAALFHVFEGCEGAISEDIFNRAAEVAMWHLSESRRFFGELAVPQHMADAARVERWLIDHCKRNKTTFISRRELQRQGCVRDGERLKAAIKELTDLDRMRIAKEGKQINLWINQAILSEGGVS